MTRHYKLSTGSNAGAGHSCEAPRGRSSLCERYGRDWVDVENGGSERKAFPHTAVSTPDNSVVASPGPPMSTRGGTAEEQSEPAVAATSSAPALASPRSTLRRLPARLLEWSAGDVADWASSTTLAPEVVQCLRDNAVNGIVLESISEADLKTMGLPKLASWLALRSQRSDLLVALRGRQPTEQPAWARSRVMTGSVTVSIGEQASPAPVRGVLHRTASVPRCLIASSCSSRSPSLPFGDIPTPGRSISSARGVSVTRLTTPIQAVTTRSTISTITTKLSQSFTPLPQKPNFSPHSITCSIKPPRSASAIKVRTQDPPSVHGTPRASSCIRTRIEYLPPVYSSSSVATVSAMSIVSAEPLGSVRCRPSAQPIDFGLQVTVRPLSPSSGRIKQGPPCRRVRSIERKDSRVPSHSPRPIADFRHAEEAGPATSPAEEEAASGVKEETIFGETVHKRGRLCDEMAQKTEVEVNNLQRQLDVLFLDGGQKAAMAAAANCSDK